MPVQFAFAREQLAQHLADAGGTWGGPPDPLAGPAPATVPSVLWNLSSPAERAALLADAGAEAPSQASPPPQPASGIDTSTIHHPYYRALSDANGGFWKHDPEGGVAVENHWMEVGTDIDGGTIYRMLTDYDVYGPGANNAFPPMNQDALLAMLAPRDALAWPKDPPATTNDARSAAAPRATTPAGQTGAAPPGSAAPPGTGDAEDIVVTARRTPVLHSPFHPLPPHHVARRLDPQGPLVQPPLQPAAAAATPPEAADAEAAPSGLPPLPTEARENPYDLLTIAIWEAQYDAAWRAANADGLRYDPVRDAEVREGFRRWRAETEARNAQLTALQLEPLRTVIPPLDLGMSAYAVATGHADVWDWLTVGTAAAGPLAVAGRGVYRAFRAGDDVAGATRLVEPGRWTSVRESMSARAEAFQTQITGRPISEAYVIGTLRFDGYRDGILLEAKGPGYAKFIRDGKFKSWFTKGEDIFTQADKQSKAALGHRIEWHVAEPEFAAMLEKKLRPFSNITVIHTPPQP